MVKIVKKNPNKINLNKNSVRKINLKKEAKQIDFFEKKVYVYLYGWYFQCVQAYVTTRKIECYKRIFFSLENLKI